MRSFINKYILQDNCIPSWLIPRIRTAGAEDRLQTYTRVFDCMGVSAPNPHAGQESSVLVYFKCVKKK